MKIVKLNILLLLSLFSISTWGAERVRSLFVEMPSELLPLLTTSDRLDFLDYSDAGMEAVVRNRLGGETKMLRCTDSMITLALTPSTQWDMKLFSKGRGLIALVTTYTIESHKDSYIQFYDTLWRTIDIEQIIDRPTALDFVKPRYRVYASRSMDRSIMYNMVSVIVKEQSDIIEFRVSKFPPMVDEESDAMIEKRIWRTSLLRYRWNGRRFKRCIINKADE